MFVAKPLDEAPKARTRRVLGKLRIPEGSPGAWLGAGVAVVVVVLLVVGFLVGRPATEMFQGYVEMLRDLQSEP